MWPLERKQQYILLAVAAMLLLVIGYKYALMQQPTDPMQTPGLVAANSAGVLMPSDGVNQMGLTGDSPATSGEIQVHVAGAVQKAGVYRLPAGARVVDAVEIAGAAEDAALDYLNLAAPLEDGRQVYVYSLEQVSQQGGIAAPPGQMVAPGLGVANASSLININTAGQGELEQLPGIGPSLAQRIIDHRSQHGSFAAIEDIMQVSGIGTKRFEQLKGKICVH